MACDICNATGRRSIELLSAYTTDDIKSVCPDCEKVLNAKVWKLRAVTDGILQAWMKRFISQRRDKRLSEPQHSQLSVNAGTARTDGPLPDGQGEQA